MLFFPCAKLLIGLFCKIAKNISNFTTQILSFFMNLNTIATIGHNGFFESSNPISFYNNDYLLHYDCIIASTTAVLNEIKATNCENEPVQFNDMTDQVIKRQNDLNDFYQLGGVMILIIDENPIWDYLAYIKGFQQANAMDILCTQQLDIQYSTQNGKGISTAETMSTLLSQAQVHFTALLQSKNHNPLIATQRTKTPLSYHQKVGNGLFVALPCITLNDGADQNVFLEDLLELFQALKAEPGVQVAETT
jgi:hypothetical protein